jgi:hypothetical protein
MSVVSKVPKLGNLLYLRQVLSLKKQESTHLMVLILEDITRLYGAETLPISCGTGFCLEMSMAHYCSLVKYGHTK